MIATADGSDRWIISAYHVLISDGRAAARDGDPIQQPAEASTVGRTVLARAHAGLDIAAARIEPGLAGVSESLGVTTIPRLGQPLPGLRVIKSGSATGVTEGVVQSVTNHAVEIRLLPGFPPSYDLTLPGDSGAAWLNRDTGEFVALHVVGNNGGDQFARGISASTVLSTLRLRVL